jgi:PAS domain S-box-containing protein
MALLARGDTNKQIAAVLHVSERAIKAHVSILLEKFGVPNRAGLIARVLTDARPTVDVLSAEYDVYENAPFLVQVLHGPEHRFAYVNRRFQQVMGRSAAGLIGRTVAEAFPARAEYLEALDRAFASGEPSTYENVRGRWRADDGSERQALFSKFYQPIRNASGSVVGLLLIGATVTGV